MINIVKKYPMHIIQLCITLSALEMCYELNRNDNSIFGLGNGRIHEPQIYDRGRYIEPYIFNKNIGRDSNSNLFTKYVHDYGMWKTLIDDLLRFDYSNNRNLTMYPINIKNQPKMSKNTGTNSSTNCIIPYLRIKNTELNGVTQTVDGNPNSNNFGFDYLVEDSSSNDIFKNGKSLDNSFYDLHLNTAVNISSEFGKNNSPLKKDAFLEHFNDNSYDELKMYSGHLKGANSEIMEQECAMADVLYKQDVDLGYTIFPIKSSYAASSSTQPNTNEEAEKVEAIQSLKDSKLAEILYQQDIDLGYFLSPAQSNDATILNDIQCLVDNNHKAMKPMEICVKELSDNASDGWAGIPFKIDNETGEYIRLPLDDLLQDILPFTDNSLSHVKSGESDKDLKVNSDEGTSSGLLDVSSDDMSLTMQSFWSSSSEQEVKGSTNIIHDNSCRQGTCSITEPETKPAEASCHIKMDSRIQDIANISTPVSGFYGINPDIAPYAYYHAHYYTPKNVSHTIPYATRQQSHPNPHREDVCFQPQFAPNLESSGNFGSNSSYPNVETHCIRNFTTTSGDLVPTEGFLSSFLNEECIQMMDISGNERSPMCNQDAILPLDNSETVASHTRDKSMDNTNSLCGNSIAERLDLSCDSAVSSLGSERVPSISDGEWGEGSDSGQDYHQNTYYGPYDYSSSSRNITARQMPVAQKKYHMFGKRYFQEQVPENSIIHSAIQFLHSTNSVSDCGGIENIVDNAAFEECTDEMLPLSNVKNISSKLTHAIVKSERDKFEESAISSQTNHETPIRHNHTYALINETTANSRFFRDNSECKDILSDGHLTRDEKRARNLNVPIPVPDIINLPMDEFNERISKFDLTESQLSLIRDIRRRGKNKVAAQNCRKRKLDQILSLEDDVKEVRRRKEKLHNDRAFIATEKKRIANKFATLHQHIFHFLRDAEGNPCSPSKYSLQQASDGSIYLLPRDSSKRDPNFHMSILISASEASSSGFGRQRRMQHNYARENLNESPSVSLGQPQNNLEHKDD